MGGKSTINTSETKIEALKLQSSAYGVTVPVVGGTTRVAGNLLYYADFKAIANTTSQSSGKGGGVKTTQTTYTYQASVIMGLCQGAITDVRTIWVGKKRYDATWVQPPTQYLTLNTTIPGSLPATVALNAGATGVQLVRTNVFNGQEGEAVFAEGADYSVDLNAGTITLLASAAMLQWQGDAIVVGYTVNQPGYSQSPAAQLGISLMPGVARQAAPSWVQTLHPSDAIGYPYTALVYAQNYSLGTGAQIENHSFEVLGFGAYSISPSIPDCNPADFARSILLDGRYGARMPSSALASFTAWSNYCLAAGLVMSPALITQTSAADFITQMAQLTNSAPVWKVNRLAMIPYGDKALTGNGGSYSPNLTPIYDLTDDHFKALPGEPPVKMTRNSAADRYNNVKLQFQNRANYYNTEVCEVKDDADIAANGLRTLDSVTGDWICDPNVAQAVATLIMQRSLNVTAQFEFKLPWAFAMLEPMDLVTLTDADLGLSKTTVRITAIEEDADGSLTVTAESFAVGVANAALYSLQTGAGYKSNYNATPQSVAPPAMFEMPVALTAQGVGLYVAACAKVGDTLWGGANVWLSLDGTTYTKFGTITGGARLGALAAAIAAGDTSARVQLSGIGGQINAATAAAAAANQSVLWIDGPQGGEYVNYTTASLNAANDYTLGLVRGAYGNPANAHGAGARVVRVDSTVLSKADLDASYLGKTLYFKFTSFNVFGAGEESLAGVPAYTYTISGGQLQLPPTTPSGLQVAGRVVSWQTVSDPDLAGYRLRMQNGVNTDWGTAIPMHSGLLTSTPFVMPYQPSGVVTILAKSVDTSGNESTGAAAAIANLGNALVNNIWESWPQATAWPGTLTGGAVSGGAIAANSLTTYWGSPSTAFWSGKTTPFWPANVWAQVQYQLPSIVTTTAGRMLIDAQLSADWSRVEYQRGDQSVFWQTGGNTFWLGSASPFWPAFTPTWAPWLGGLDLLVNEPMALRVTLAGGANQGQMSLFTPKMDVPDVSEVVQGAAIAPGGSRLALSKTYRVIKNVNCAVRVDGNGGVGVQLVDKNASAGPLIQVINSAGTSVAGTVDATIQGY